jgi:hypothetical protein
VDALDQGIGGKHGGIACPRLPQRGIIANPQHVCRYGPQPALQEGCQPGNQAELTEITDKKMGV